MKTSFPNVSWILGLVITSIFVHSGSASPETSVSTGPGDARATNETKKALERLFESRVFNGAAAVQKNGRLVFSEAFGSASEVGPASVGIRFSACYDIEIAVCQPEHSNESPFAPLSENSRLS